LLAAVWLFALAAPAPAASEFEDTLLRLASRALGEGDLATAANRYQRVLDANPGSAVAQLGLGDVAARRGDTAGAAKRYQAALAIDPALAAAQLGLAELAHARGDAATARARLDAALEVAPLDPRIHQRRLEWTGLAPPGPVAGPEAVRARARAHPYDPRAQLAAARLAIAEGHEAAARAELQRALLTADLAPAAAPAAAKLLASLDATERRFVPVHLYADETVRADPGWEFELRLSWGRASAALRPLLATTFVPIAIHPFSSDGLSDDLGSIDRAMLASIERLPLDGIIAGFTRRGSPRTPQAHRLGEAQYFGREMVVRIDPKDLQGRTLAHEILHLYGAMHLSPEIPSLMNPSGGEWTLDPYNAAIIRLTASRRFGPGSFERNVLQHVEDAALADALVHAIAVNVRFRNAGIAEALSEARTSRVVGRMRARRATGDDSQLALVARLTAFVLIRADRPAEGVLMMESAARLYGPRSAEGRAAQKQADRWRAAYKAFLAH